MGWIKNWRIGFARDRHVKSGFRHVAQGLGSDERDGASANTSTNVNVDVSSGR